MLSKYIEALREQAGDQSHVSFSKLASVAGIHTSGSTCPECGDEMVKSASLLKCACGMMKMAALSTPALGRIARWAPLAGGAAVGAGTGALAAGPDNRTVGALGGGLLGAGIGGSLGADAANLMTHSRAAAHQATRANAASDAAMPIILKGFHSSAAGDARPALRAAMHGAVNKADNQFISSAAKRNALIGAGSGALGGGSMVALRDTKEQTKEAEGEMIEPGLVGSMQGMTRAQQRSGEGLGQMVASPEVIKARLKGSLAGLGIGGALGGGLGALIGHRLGDTRTGAALGAAGGGLTGQMIGGDRANRQHLQSQGIHPKWHGLTARFTPEAVERFLPEKRDMLMGHDELNKAAGFAQRAVTLIANSFEKNAELWQPGVLEQGHAGTGEKLKLLPALGDTPPEDGSRREEQLGDRRHQEASGVAGGTETGTRDIGVGPSGLTYELTNSELVKKAAAGMPGRK